MDQSQRLSSDRKEIADRLQRKLQDHPAAGSAPRRECAACILFPPATSQTDMRAFLFLNRLYSLKTRGQILLICGNKIFPCVIYWLKNGEESDMPGYRRFVSYIYEYSHGRKSRNTGFAKVESRGGVLKLQVSMQGISPEAGVLEIYAFVREEGWLKGILLGKTRMNMSSMEIRLMTPADHVGNVDYSMDRLSGLWISSEHGGTYLSIWDEEPVDLSKLTPLVPEAGDAAEENQQNVTEEEEAEGGQEERHEEGEAEQEPEAFGRVERKDESAENITQKTEEPEVNNAEIREAQKPEEESVEAEGEEERSVQTEEAVVEAGKIECQEEEEISEERESPQKKAVSKMEGDVKAAQNSCGTAARGCTPPCSHCPRYQSALDQRWRQLAGCRVHVQPFEDEQIDDCLQVSPRELGILYQSRYPVGRNSFLMHGYYNYHHLLFGRYKDGSYFLGVPGIYENQEKMMASMFGFPEFLKAREQKQMRGQFGYWCRKVGRS